MAAYEARIAAADAEKRQLGLLEIDAKSEAMDKPYWALVDRIPQIAGSLEAVAATVMLEMNHFGSATDSFDDGNDLTALAALKGLRPMISGPVALAVDDYINNPSRMLGHGPLWGSHFDVALTADGHDGDGAAS